MIPLQSFNTPEEAYRWAKRNRRRLRFYKQDSGGRWWHLLHRDPKKHVGEAIYSLVPSPKKARKS